MPGFTRRRVVAMNQIARRSPHDGTRQSPLPLPSYETENQILIDATLQEGDFRVLGGTFFAIQSKIQSATWRLLRSIIIICVLPRTPFS